MDAKYGHRWKDEECTRCKDVRTVLTVEQYCPVYVEEMTAERDALKAELSLVESALDNAMKERERLLLEKHKLNAETDILREAHLDNVDQIIEAGRRQTLTEKSLARALVEVEALKAANGEMRRALEDISSQSECSCSLDFMCDACSNRETAKIALAKHRATE